MSNAFPLESDAFSGGARLTAQQQSEGRASDQPPLYELMNLCAFGAEEVVAMSADIDLEAATVAAVASANRRLITNAGAARSFTLPDFASAPDGWEQTFISLDAGTNELTIAVDTGGTINGVAGDITLTSASHEWVKVMKTPGASGWFAIGGTLVTPA